MTVRTAINCRRLRDELTAHEEGATSPLIGDVLDAMFAAGRRALEEGGLIMPNGDGWAESEAVIFDAIRRANPGKVRP